MTTALEYGAWCDWCERVTPHKNGDCLRCTPATVWTEGRPVVLAQDVVPVEPRMVRKRGAA